MHRGLVVTPVVLWRLISSVIRYTSATSFWQSRTLELAADGHQTAGLVTQSIHTVAEDVFVRAVGPQHHVKLLPFTALTYLHTDLSLHPCSACEVKVTLSFWTIYSFHSLANFLLQLPQQQQLLLLHRSRNACSKNQIPVSYS